MMTSHSSSITPSCTSALPPTSCFLIPNPCLLPPASCFTYSPKSSTCFLSASCFQPLDVCLFPHSFTPLHCFTPPFCQNYHDVHQINRFKELPGVHCTFTCTQRLSLQLYQLFVLYFQFHLFYPLIQVEHF